MQDSKRGYAVWQFILTVCTTALFSVVATVGVMTDFKFSSDDSKANGLSDDSCSATNEPIGPTASNSTDMYRYAAQVANTYTNNTIDGDEMFKDKTMYVIGEVFSVDSNDEGIVVVLKNQWMGWVLECYIRKLDKPAAAELSRSSWVVIKGLCVGKNSNVSVKFADCVVVAHESPSAQLFGDKSITDWAKGIPELSQLMNK